MSNEWREAYKTIYGKSPCKSDYILAPSNTLKKNIKSESEIKEDGKGHNLCAPTRLKRPMQYSPVKKIIKKRAIQLNEDEVGGKPVAVPSRSSPRKKVVLSSSSAATQVNKAIFAPLSSDSFIFKSPVKQVKADGETAGKLLVHSLNSPRKPLASRRVLICADTLFETKSPVKRVDEPAEKVEDKLEEADEETLEGMRRQIIRKKKADTNFLRLNMKKGYHAKGKLTAEQKRKFKRKANFKKFKTS